MAEEEWGARRQMRVEEPDQPGEILLDRGLGGPAGSTRMLYQGGSSRAGAGQCLRSRVAADEVEPADLALADERGALL